jgi:hypothetical protein
MVILFLSAINFRFCGQQADATLSVNVPVNVPGNSNIVRYKDLERQVFHSPNELEGDGFLELGQQFADFNSKLE